LTWGIKIPNEAHTLAQKVSFRLATFLASGVKSVLFGYKLAQTPQPIATQIQSCGCNQTFCNTVLQKSFNRIKLNEFIFQKSHNRCTDLFPFGRVHDVVRTCPAKGNKGVYPNKS